MCLSSLMWLCPTLTVPGTTQGSTTPHHCPHCHKSHQYWHFCHQQQITLTTIIKFKYLPSLKSMAKREGSFAIKNMRMQCHHQKKITKKNKHLHWQWSQCDNQSNHGSTTSKTPINERQYIKIKHMPTLTLDGTTQESTTPHQCHNCYKLHLLHYLFSLFCLSFLTLFLSVFFFFPLPSSFFVSLFFSPFLSFSLLFSLFPFSFLSLPPSSSKTPETTAF